MVADSKLTLTYPKANRPDQQARTLKLCQVGSILVGSAGESPYTEQIFRWVKTKRTRPLKFSSGADIEALFLITGEIHQMDECGELMKLDQDFYAIGSGAHAALGALYAGASPIEAVEIACKIDPHSEPPIQILRLKDV
jgi:hypothetical protein